MHIPPYESTNSPLSRAGVDGAECILHAWNGWSLNNGASSTKMRGQSGNVGRERAAGQGTASKYGESEYDFYVRDTTNHHKLKRDGTSLKPYIPNDQISAAVVQLATDVQRWRCMDDIKKTGNKYLPCGAWNGADGIAVRFERSE
jgi:hypothetical protein